MLAGNPATNHIVGFGARKDPIRAHPVQRPEIHFWSPFILNCTSVFPQKTRRLKLLLLYIIYESVYLIISYH